MVKKKSKNNVRSPSPADVWLGQKIKEERILNGLSMTKLANILGITFQQIQKYEQGLNRISFSRLLEIGNILEIDIKELTDNIPKDILKGLPKKNSKLEEKSSTKRQTLELVKKFDELKHDRSRKKVLGAATMAVNAEKEHGYFEFKVLKK